MPDEELKKVIIFNLKKAIAYGSMSYIAALVAMLILLTATLTKSINPFTANPYQVLILLSIIIYSKVTVKIHIKQAHTMGIDIMKEMRESNDDKK